MQRQNAPSLAFSAPWLGDAIPALDALLERALAKDPDARIASAAALAEELEAIARQHDLLASHAEVRESFPAAMRAELDDRRRRVNAALANAPEHTPASATGESLPAQVVPAPPPAKRPLARVVVPAAIAGALAAAIGAMTLTDNAPMIASSSTTNAVASDRQTRADDLRGRAPSPTQTPAVPTPTHAKAGPTPALAAPASTPAGFAPRPNPYDHH